MLTRLQVIRSPTLVPISHARDTAREVRKFVTLRASGSTQEPLITVTVDGLVLACDAILMYSGRGDDVWLHAEAAGKAIWSRRSVAMLANRMPLPVAAVWATSWRSARRSLLS